MKNAIYGSSAWMTEVITTSTKKTEVLCDLLGDTQEAVNFFCACSKAAGRLLSSPICFSFPIVDGKRLSLHEALRIELYLMRRLQYKRQLKGFHHCNYVCSCSDGREYFGDFATLCT